MADGRDQQRARGSKPTHELAQGRSPSGSDSKLAKLARAMGNDEIQQRISRGNASRDLMLAHLCDRLGTMHQLQQRELELTRRGSHFSWWRDVADANKPEYTSPEPTRWNEAARMYEDAAQHLCRGDLKRGRDLMTRAMDEEQRARDNLTILVETGDLEEGRIGMELPSSGATEVAGACDLPDDVGLAREIYNVTTESPEIPNRPRVDDPWWTLDEEEEEEEPGEPGGS